MRDALITALYLLALALLAFFCSGSVKAPKVDAAAEFLRHRPILALALFWVVGFVYFAFMKNMKEETQKYWVLLKEIFWPTIATLGLGMLIVVALCFLAALAEWGLTALFRG